METCLRPLVSCRLYTAIGLMIAVKPVVADKLIYI